MTPPSATIASLYRLLAGNLILRPSDGGNVDRALSRLHARVTETPECVNVQSLPDPQDYGRLIGKGGATFKSMRTVLEIVCDRHERRLNYSQQKPDGNNPPPAPFVRNRKWDNEPLRLLVRRTCELMFQHRCDLDLTEFGNETYIVVKLDDTEQLQARDEDVRDALRTLVVAIGKARGRVVRFDLGRRG